MKVLAHIIDGIVFSTHEYVMAAEFHKDFVMINITDLQVKPEVGDLYDGVSFNKPDVVIEIKTEREERNWRDAEIERTDKLVILPDYPAVDDLLLYRMELRDYPAQTDFPNGTRPEEGVA